MANVKWLTSIDVLAEPFEGFQQAVAYRYQQSAAGNRQPLEAPWNYQGMGNNVVQRIPVTVR
jgi:hypothetical protein